MRRHETIAYREYYDFRLLQSEVGRMGAGRGVDGGPCPTHRGAATALHRERV